MSPSFFKKIFGKKTADTDTAAQVERFLKDLRNYERFSLWDWGQCQITIEGVSGSILDLSFSGVAIGFQSQETTPDLEVGKEYQATLRLFNEEVVVHLVHVRAAAQLLGLRFHHDLPPTLVFLGEFLENLRGGGTLVETAKENIKERYRGSEWLTLRGEGPVDLLIKRNPAGELEEALLSFRKNEEYREVIYREGRLTTGVAIDQTGFGVPRVSQTQTPELDIIKQAMTILMGIKSTDLRKIVLPMVKNGLEILEVPNDIHV